MMMNNTAVVIKVALVSRLAILFIQYIFNLLIPDHRAEAFLYPGYNEAKSNSYVFHFLGGLLRWDAQYFIHIAKYGYTFENVVAFFPLYPFLVRIVGNLGISMFINIDSALLFSACFINIVLFCLSALSLYRLTLIFFSEDFARKTVLLFCLNPASIFFSAPYTECLFSYLSFKTMLNCVILYQKYSVKSNDLRLRDFHYLTPIALSTITRSNGLLNIGFLLYTIACIGLKKFVRFQVKDLKYMCKYILCTFLAVILCVMPFIIFQDYVYRKFCLDFSYNVSNDVKDYAKQHKLILQGEYSKHKQIWCSNYIPLSYSYVQQKYWNVGFLKYYEIKQIPNFLLAGPVIFIILSYTVGYLYKNLKPNLYRIFTFGCILSNENVNIFHPIILVYVIHVSFLTMFSIAYIHIQVSTRMILSASPIVYWYCAYQFLSLKLRQTSIMEMLYLKPKNRIQKFIKLYFISYFVLGTVMFCNFLPWT